MGTISYSPTMSPANQLQALSDVNSLVASAIAAQKKSHFMVIARQVDATLDPGVASTGDAFLLTDISALHANFYGPIAGASNNDIVKWNGASYEVFFDASIVGEGPLCSVTAENQIDYFTGTAWQDIKAMMLLDLVDNTADINKPVSTPVQTAIDNAVAGLYDNKGAYDASTNTPDLDTSPSGIKNGDAYTVSVAGTFYTESLEVGDVLIASQDNPTLLTHWAKINKNISFGTTAGTACEGDDSRLTPQTSSGVTFTPDGDIASTDVQSAIVEVRDEIDAKIASKEDSANKDSSGGFVGLTLFKMNFKNALNTFMSFFTNANTASRTYTFQDRDGVIADDTDLSAKQNSLGFTAENTSNKDTDTTLAANSDTNYTSQKAIKSYVDTAVALKAPLASPSFTGTASFASLVDISAAGAGQIKFPATQNPSADANTIDDYEEGSFSPTLQDTSHSDAEGQTYVAQDGYYVKVGKKVHIQGLLFMSSIGTLTTSSGAFLAGLPFSTSSSSVHSSGISGHASGLSIGADESISLFIQKGVTWADLRLWDSTSGSNALKISNVTAGGAIYFSATYLV